MPTFTKEPLTSAKELRVSRIATIVIGLGGIVFALTFSGIFEIMLIAYGIFVSGLFFPIMGALFWKKVTRTGVIASIIASAAVMIAFLFMDTDIDVVVPASITSFIVLIAVSLATYRKEKLTPPVLEAERLQQ